MQKWPTDATGERDSLNNEYRILKEKPGQEVFQKFQEKVYNEPGQPVPAGTYIMTKPDTLIPIRISIDFNERKIQMSLWEKKS
jgi:hypothetical protein